MYTYIYTYIYIQVNIYVFEKYVNDIVDQNLWFESRVGGEEQEDC